MILGLAGYTASRNLGSMVAVEPACGAGAFLGPMVERLSSSCRAHGHTLADARRSIRAFDLLACNVDSSRRLVEKILIEDEWDATEAAAVAEEWVREGDYLLADDAPAVADFVLGNPPYIRLEDVPNDRMAAYRAYGRELRRLVTDEFSVQASMTMHDVDAFDEQVSAYPAVTVLRRSHQGSDVVADTTREFSASDASALVRWSRHKKATPVSNGRYEVARLPRWFDSGDSWPSGSPARLALIEDLNDRFRPLEDPETGTRVGIGVATGADGVFVTKEANVEPDRLLPLSMVRDTTSGTLSWSGHFW